MSLLVCSDCSTRYASGLECCPNCRSVDRVEEGAAGSPGSRLPFLDVVCPTAGCRAFGVVRRIHIPLIVPGVVERSTYACVPCGAVMLPVAGWPSLAGMEENMPKITRHGGATNRNADEPAPPSEQVEGSEQPSPGSSSETSAEKPQTSPETSEADRPKPARTTASRSSKGRAGSSTARSTASSGEADAS